MTSKPTSRECLRSMISPDSIYVSQYWMDEEYFEGRSPINTTRGNQKDCLMTTRVSFKAKKRRTYVRNCLESVSFCIGANLCLFLDSTNLAWFVSELIWSCVNSKEILMLLAWRSCDVHQIGGFQGVYAMC